MMEAVHTSETPVNSYQSTQRYNPEDGHLLIIRFIYNPNVAYFLLHSFKIHYCCFVTALPNQMQAKSLITCETMANLNKRNNSVEPGMKVKSPNTRGIQTPWISDGQIHGPNSFKTRRPVMTLLKNFLSGIKYEDTANGMSF
jgi:hypothetical protein